MDFEKAKRLIDESLTSKEACTELGEFVREEAKKLKAYFEGLETGKARKK